MRKVLINDENKAELENLFDQFLVSKGWDGDERLKLMYCFFHTMGMINSNLTVNNENKNLTFDSDLAAIRASVLDEAIAAVQSCELVSPNVRRIHLDSAVGALITLK